MRMLARRLLQRATRTAACPWVAVAFRARPRSRGVRHMRPHRVLSLALAAFVVSAVASCAGGDGGSPTGSDPSASGSDPRPNGTQLGLVTGGSQTGLAGQPLPSPVVVRV